jgi:type IV pilus assembly protein PilA
MIEVLHHDFIAEKERPQGGFTLIELMVVVAIVGILVSIAGPQFQKYQRKARQSEAKIALAAIFGLEKSFFNEYSAYAPDLVAIGYSPEGLKRFYNHGLCNGPPSGTITGWAGGAFTTPYYLMTGSPFTYAFNLAPGNTCNIPAVLDAWCNVNDSQMFTAFANGVLCASCYNDTWIINHNKILTNCGNGL